jgi:hypothetical protein
MSPTVSPQIATAVQSSWALDGDMPNVWGPGPFATELRGGRVLVVGHTLERRSSGTYLSQGASLYDPTSGTWSAAEGPTMGVGSATLLTDGTVLVTGAGPSGMLAQRYDPNTGRWTSTGSMMMGRPGFSETKSLSEWEPAGYTATLLDDGRVLVAGGTRAPYGSNRVVPNAELYDLATGRWAATGSMLQARANHTATRLRDGRVLVAGGAITPTDGSVSALDSAELYDPSTGRWTATGRLRSARAFHSAILLSDGSVLVAGDGVRNSTSTERYEPSEGRWTAGGSMLVRRHGQTAT